jgi:hypothetical protein
MGLGMVLTFWDGIAELFSVVGVITTDSYNLPISQCSNGLAMDTPSFQS